jgi:hypothetical protein
MSARPRHNEYDVPNGLGQIILQAVARNAREAILVIMDGSRGAPKAWNAHERQFDTFTRNLLKVRLTVLRVVVDTARQGMDFETP